MIINTSQVEMVLNNKAIPAYSLEAETGVSRDRISKLRRGDIKFENMSLKTIMKIQKWIDDGNYKFSYDYTELIEEIKTDMLEGLLDEYIYIVRGNFIEAIGTSPVIDYYYSPEEIEDGDVAEKVRTTALLVELELYNKII
ncbi:TPA: hypothetical protein ACGORA_000375 [Streptococcus suis]